MTVTSRNAPPECSRLLESVWRQLAALAADRDSLASSGHLAVQFAVNDIDAGALRVIVGSGLPHLTEAILGGACI